MLYSYYNASFLFIFRIHKPKNIKPLRLTKPEKTSPWSFWKLVPALNLQQQKVSMYSTYVIWPLFSHTIHYKAVTVIFFSSFWDQIHFDDVIKKLVYLLTMTAHMSRNFNMSSLSTIGCSRFSQTRVKRQKIKRYYFPLLYSLIIVDATTGKFLAWPLQWWGRLE